MDGSERGNRRSGPLAMMLGDSKRQLVLASASEVRARLLRDAGVPFCVEPAAIDEETAREGLRALGSRTEDAASALAELKALAVAARHDERTLVLGCDQILECEGEWFAKPRDREEARAQLRRLRGRRHRLVSAGVLVCAGSRLWHKVETAELWVRSFSDEFLEWYLETAGSDLLRSVGAYRIEGIGIQLFARIEGDIFTILGLPLLSLLQALRDQGLLAR
ncbi:Septum formation protein Maf [bacterium HR40]|nr:Septum formation protein Maf [bacterium HR40]